MVWQEQILRTENCRRLRDCGIKTSRAKEFAPIQYLPLCQKQCLNGATALLGDLLRPVPVGDSGARTATSVINMHIEIYQP